MEKSTINHIERKRIAPKLFLLYLAFASMIMFFSAFCSALIVRKGDYRQAWGDITLPEAFLISTIIIILSSVTIQMAYRQWSMNLKFQGYGILTFILGIVFLALQYSGWLYLQERQIFLSGNPSGSYIYVISMFHGLHYIGGLVALFVILFKSRKGVKDEERKMNFNVLTQYWHFIGLIWVSLYLFFKFIIYK